MDDNKQEQPKTGEGVIEPTIVSYNDLNDAYEWGLIEGNGRGFNAGIEYAEEQAEKEIQSLLEQARSQGVGEGYEQGYKNMGRDLRDFFLDGEQTMTAKEVQEAIDSLTKGGLK